MVSPRRRGRGDDSKGEAYTRLRSMLLGGEVRPGQRLSHRALAKDLGLSRSPVREALLALEAEGIIEHRPQSGVYLRDVSVRELDELYDMRELIEPYAAGRAADVADAAQITHLSRVCDDFDALVSRPDFVDWVDAPENRRRLSMLDRDFHTTILTAAGNRVARQFFENAQVLSLVVSWNFLKADSATIAARAVPTSKQHRRIYEAIRTRDSATAARLMQEHIAGMKDRVLATARRSHDGPEPSGEAAGAAAG
jgi:DNA-binding GntR family transcriptional regulator